MASCSNTDEARPVSPGNTPVTLQLNWSPDPTFTGAYIASSSTKNFFAHEGLTVKIQPGGFGVDPIAPVVAKKAQFAIVGADKAAIQFANGVPIRVVAVEFQRNPVGWIAKRSSGITSIPDLADNKIMSLGDKTGTETTPIMKLILKRLKLADKIKTEPVGFEISYFIKNPNVVYPVYLNEEPVTARHLGVDIVEIDPSVPVNGGLKLYGNVIIAHRDTVMRDPALIQAFLKGLRKGWLFAKSRPDEAEKILRLQKSFDTPQMKEVLARSITFATFSDGVDVPPGHMEVAKWENTIDTLLESSLLRKKIKVKDLVWFSNGF